MSETNSSESDLNLLLCCADCKYSEFEHYGQDEEQRMVYGTKKGIYWCKKTYKVHSKSACGAERVYGKCGKKAINFKLAT